jgi:hypothetical protein
MIAPHDDLELLQVVPNAALTTPFFTNSEEVLYVWMYSQEVLYLGGVFRGRSAIFIGRGNYMQPLSGRDISGWIRSGLLMVSPLICDRHLNFDFKRLLRFQLHC